MSGNMKFTKTEIQQMRMEIITMLDGRPREQTRICQGLHTFRNNMVVKYSPGTHSKDEFENQLRVWTLVDPSIVRVPQPIDHFQYTYPGRRHPTGFIVMEYVAVYKQQLERLSDAQIDQVATIIEHLMTFKDTAPGGLEMGAWDRGIMFGDFAYKPKPGSMEVLNQWIHKRRNLWPDTKPKSFADFGESDLVLCHMDISPEDILWPVDGGAPWLLNWKRAVYLPRLFQHFIHVIGGKGGFHERILSKLEPLTERETELRSIFLTAWGNSVRADIPD